MLGSAGSLANEAVVRSQAANTLLRLFDSLYEGAVVIGRDGRISWMNDKFKALIGWNGIEPIEGMPVEEVIPNSRLREVVETGRADLLDVFPANQHQLVVSRIPLTDDNGLVVGALGVILYDRLQALRPLVSKFQQMQDDLAQARRELDETRRAKYRFSQFIGVSEPIRVLKAQARRAAARDATVLLLGETGTGKELLAHAIHAASPRAARPLIRINAAAIPETLLEAELFGVSPGAYTGAGSKPRPGEFELAEGGTLFLDEIGDMPLSLQAKLLRVLQEREIEPLGSGRVRSVDVRVIAATSRDLRRMMEAGAFRADLFYRLNVLPLVIPPLRERPEDIPVLCDALLEKLSADGSGAVRDVASDALQRLCQHEWPGNVRELDNVLQQAAALDDAPTLTVAHFAGMLPGASPSPRPVGMSAPTVRPLRETVADAERAAMLQSLHAANGVKLRAARLLGISRAQFYEKLASLGLVSEISDRRKAV